MNDRDRTVEAETDALELDVYIESLLAGTAFEDRAPATDDPALGPTARLLERGLVRFHPSFRFEEDLGRRLRAEARAATPIGVKDPIPFPTDRSRPRRPESAETGEPRRGRLAWPDVEHRLVHPRSVPHGRGLLLGGAIASGVSLAGAAVVAWRRTHTTPTALGRAARAAHALRRSQRRARSSAGEGVG